MQGNIQLQSSDTFLDTKVKLCLSVTLYLEISVCLCQTFTNNTKIIIMSDKTCLNDTIFNLDYYLKQKCMQLI